MFSSNHIRKYPAKVVGKLCYLTPVSEEFTPMMAHFLADYETSRFIGSFRNNYPELLEGEKLHAMRNDSSQRTFGIIVNDGEKFIGLCTLKNIHPVNRTAEVGIVIGDRDFIGKWIGTEAHAMLLDFAFQVLGLESIMLTYVDRNTGAAKSYEKIGYEVFGTWPFSRFVDGNKCSQLYAYIDPEKFYERNESFLNPPKAAE